MKFRDLFGQNSFFWLRLFLFPLLVGLLALADPWRSVSYLLAFLAFFLYALFSWSKAWLIVLFLIPLQEMAPPLFNQPKLLPHRFLLILAAAALLVKIFRQKEHDLKSILHLLLRPGFLTFALFVLANIFSAFYNRSLDALFRSLTYTEPLFYFALTWMWINSEKNNLSRLSGNFVLAGFWTQVIGLMEMATQKSIRRLLAIPSSTPWEELFATDRFGLGGRISSTLSHPVYAGLYFLFLLLISIYFFSHFKPRHKFLLLILVPLNLFLLLATGTRAVIICFFLSLLVLAISFRPQKRIFVPILASLLTGLIFIFFFFPQIPLYFQKSFKIRPGIQESANIRHRLVLTRTFLDVFAQKPIFGNGPGLIQKEALKEGSSFKKMSGIENQYAIILADGGLLAGLAYLAFIIAVFWEVRRLGQLRSEPDIYLGHAFLLAAFVAYFFFVITETCLTQAPNYVLMSLFGALSGSRQRNLDVMAIRNESKI
jgi:hypothetical protein